jgi:light-regulated signal transduction histidine kinase (bacteriophytochrome)
MDPTATTLFKMSDALAEQPGTPQDIFRAALNILEDFNAEKESLEDAQRATLNILEDFEAEKAKVQAVNQTLGIEIAERKQAQERVTKLNKELERHAAQLSSANKELEAFSYSVSHDLRAPLRGIDGWSLALLEDYGDHFDKQGRQYLDRVRSETQRMGQLIDDMLQLSRLTRAEMRQEPVNLSGLAQTIAARLQETEPGRQVDFNIQAGLSARGDASLLEAVLSNLLGNAFKFTSQRAQARIEFGQTETHSQRVFFVRDNGAGFDMAYAEKLFGAFQRLHKASEFPGTGVGLAIVQRVIHRHGGRVWVEAVVNDGATFYFTLEEAV